MKKFFILLLISFTFLHKAHSQTIIDTSADYTITILDKTYKYHILKEGESLLALAKVYKIPLEQILNTNHFTEKKIKPGRGIKLPIYEKEEDIKLIDTVISTLHKVNKSETIYSIAKKYNISPNLLIEFNPSIKKNGLKRDKYIKIPQIVTKKDIEDEFFIYHITRRGESPQLIALYYNIPQSDLMEFNSPDNFEYGKVIVVPKKHYDPKQISILRADYLELPDLTGLDELKYTSNPNPPCRYYRYSSDTIFNIALLLPLFIEENNAQEININQKQLKLYDKTEIFYQFLLGSFIALDEFSQLGINVNLHIYDTRKESIRIRNILERPEIKDMDLIIGPVYSSNYNIVRDYSFQYNINFVSPLSNNRNILEHNPFIFLVNPSKKMLMHRIAQFITPSIDTVKTIIFTEKFNQEQTQHSQELISFIKQMAWEKLGLDRVEIEAIEFEPTGKIGYYILSKEKTNIVVIPSGNETFVNSLLNQLNALKNVYGYKILVIGLPSWDNFRNFDYKWFLSLNIHYPSAYFIDKNNELVKQFIAKYIKNYNKLPSHYSYIGYDIINYFVHALYRYGKTFQFCLSPFAIEPSPHGIFLNFEFQRINPYSGFENNAVFIIYYDNELKMHKIDNFYTNY